MLNKKITSLCMLAMMGGTFLVNSSSVFAARSQDKSTIISYDGSEDIADPDYPFDPHYVVSTPGNVTFTDSNKVFNGEVEMLAVDEDGNTSPYEGDGVADVFVKSNGQFKLALANGSDEVSYDYLYASNAGDTATIDRKADNTQKDFQKLFSINKDNSKYKVRYKLTGKTTKKGVHTDTLTYQVSSTTLATN